MPSPRRPIGTHIELAQARNVISEESKERISIDIFQINHGFLTGDVVRSTGSSWVKASADTPENAEVFGVAERVDKDNATIVMRGRIRGLSGLTSGQVYYLSPTLVGKLTNVAPSTAGVINKPVLFANSPTDGIVLDSRGIEITDGALSSETIGYDPNSLADNFQNPTPTNIKAAIDQLAQYIIPVGTPLPWFSNALPEYGNWIWLNGAAISRITYSKLFEVYGTNFGMGDGVLTFNLPDLRGRTIFGRSNIGGIDGGQPSGIDPSKNQIGIGGGSHQHTLTINEMPSHNHSYVDRYSVGTTSRNSGTSNARDDNYNDESKTTGSTGGGLPHNNMPPFLTGNWITRYA